MQLKGIKFKPKINVYGLVFLFLLTFYQIEFGPSFEL